MRKLDRSSVTPPTGLSSYRHGRQNWGDISLAHKAEIRASLEEMQGRRCAYCEGSLDDLGEHIEHFCSRHAHPHLTFDWVNLYWSCDKDDSCGRHKDNSAGHFDVSDLVDPCADDPDRFFRFRSDGTIDICKNLDDGDIHRAEETIRVFNLDPDHGRLRHMRKGVVSGYIRNVEAISELEPDDREDFVRDEIEQTKDLPFSTVIRHVFEQAL
jgi:uncharacterized protein (TIGR02646 family)